MTDHNAADVRPFDKHIPKLFFLFFAVVFIANGALIASAFSSWTGLVEDNHYERGRHYNDEIAMRRAMIEADLVPMVAIETHDNTLSVTLEFDRMPQGVTARLRRPLGELDAIELPLEIQARNQFGATVPRPAPGQWDFELTIMDGSATYGSVTRHFVPGR